MRGKASGRTSIQHYSNPAIWIANINPFFHDNIIPKSIRLRTKELAFKNREGPPLSAGLRDLASYLSEISAGG
jgi:hypothetical protein